MGAQCFIDLDLMMLALRYHIIYYFSDGGHDPPYLRFPPRVVPFDEISVYRSDPRHVTKLMSRRDGLDVVIAVGTRGCDGF